MEIINRLPWLSEGWQQNANSPRSASRFHLHGWEVPDLHRVTKGAQPVSPIILSEKLLIGNGWFGMMENTNEISGHVLGTGQRILVSTCWWSGFESSGSIDHLVFILVPLFLFVIYRHAPLFLSVLHSAVKDALCGTGACQHRCSLWDVESQALTGRYCLPLVFTLLTFNSPLAGTLQGSSLQVHQCLYPGVCRVDVLWCDVSIDYSLLNSPGCAPNGE